jgi:nucleotide-binding universal stress UspA family protein
MNGGIAATIGDSAMLKTILVPTDGSDHARRAVDLAADLAAKYQAKVILLHVLLRGHLPEGLMRAAEVEHVVHPGPGGPRNLAIMPQEIMARVDREVQAPLEVLEFIAGNVMADAEAAVRAKGVAEVEAVVEQGDTAQQILDKAVQSGADMIVLGSRGLGGLEGLLMGSVSQKVSHHAPCTCVTVR